MKRTILFALCLFLLSSCSINYGLNMRNFIIGRWKGEFPLEISGTNSTKVKYEIEFLPFNILFVDITRPEEAIRGLRLSYRFITDNRIIIEGRIINELQVASDHQNLIIVNSDHGLPPQGRYERVISVLELFIVLLLLVILSTM